MQILSHTEAEGRTRDTKFKAPAATPTKAKLPVAAEIKVEKPLPHQRLNRRDLERPCLESPPLLLLLRRPRDTPSLPRSRHQLLSGPSSRPCPLPSLLERSLLGSSSLSPPRTTLGLGTPLRRPRPPPHPRRPKIPSILLRSKRLPLLRRTRTPLHCRGSPSRGGGSTKAKRPTAKYPTEAKLPATPAEIKIPVTPVEDETPASDPTPTTPATEVPNEDETPTDAPTSATPAETESHELPTSCL